MDSWFDLLLKIRASSLEEMLDIVVNRIRRLLEITRIELMSVLRTTKEEQSVS